MHPTLPQYCPYYCEENIWQLCNQFGIDNTHWLAILISNPARQVALWQQCAITNTQQPILWDYHVIAAQQQLHHWHIWNLDSRCGLPTPAHAYLQQSFRPTTAMLQPLFRVMSSGEYLATLASDRRHMRDASGRFLQPPPDWPSIGHGHNLHQLIDMQWHGAGETLDLAALTKRLSPPEQ